MEKHIPTGAKMEVPLSKTIVVPFLNRMVCCLIALMVISIIGCSEGGNSLINTQWQHTENDGRQATFSFRDTNYVGTGYGGNVMMGTYKISGNIITLTDRNGAVVEEFRLRGNRLIAENDGSIFTKVK